MLRTATLISFAFIGTLVGAGFASGQEAMLYFSAFGTQGIWGAVMSSALMLIAGVAFLQLGSYFRANEHMDVLGPISSKVMSTILDVATIVTLFSVGFVMFAGAGANLNQQFGLPVWIGAVIMLALTLGVGMLDVDKVTGAIGALTPFLLILIIIGCGWTILHAHPDWAALNAYVDTNVETTLPNWWIGALNYTGLNVICVASMAMVIGGNELNTRAAGLGGFLGGVAYLIMLMLLSVSLLLKIDVVYGEDMPLLSLVTDINSTLGLVMALVIFGMIFATSLGMFYALGKRLARGREEKFRRIYIIACVVGFALSFVGFQTLVSVVYPILGYLGLLLILVVTAAWLRGLPKLRKEGQRRKRAMELTRAKLDPRERFTKNDERELEHVTSMSIVDDDELSEALSESVTAELVADEEVDFEPEDAELDPVVYVSYTEPVTQAEYEKNPDEPWNDTTVDELIAADAEEIAEREAAEAEAAADEAHAGAGTSSPTAGSPGAGSPGTGSGAGSTVVRPSDADNR